MNTESQNLKQSGHADANRYLQGIKDCNRQIVEEIYSRFSKDIERLIIQNNGTSEDAKDVFQEVMMSLFRQAHAGLVLKCNFYTFLHLACKKRWLNVLNSKYSSRTSTGEEVLGTIVSISDEVNDVLREDERMKLICEKLKMMHDGCKEVIELSWKTDNNGKHLGWQEIANILNVSYAYVRKRASECKSRLAELVRKDYRYNELIS